MPSLKGVLLLGSFGLCVKTQNLFHELTLELTFVLTLPQASLVEFMKYRPAGRAKEGMTE